MDVLLGRAGTPTDEVSSRMRPVRLPAERLVQKSPHGS